MPAIDRWVIRSVFAALRGPDIVMPSGTVAINLSGQSLSDRQFLEFVEQQIEASAVVLERICFEITETAAISNLSLAKRFFSALKPRGCRFALDDFGSGLSSFAYLKTLSVGFLKIDGGFVKDMMRDPIDHAMVEAIHSIGHVMGLQTIAESVEDERILARLKAIGVNYAQGYAVGKPRPLRKLAQS
jgi:EAL domain-containing protein (putative c-di-GMP-specific phosphodiesterase class I)